MEDTTKDETSSIGVNSCRSSRESLTRLWQHLQKEQLGASSPLRLDCDYSTSRFRDVGDVFLPAFSDEWLWLMGMYNDRKHIRHDWSRQWACCATMLFDRDCCIRHTTQQASDHHQSSALPHLTSTSDTTTLQRVKSLRGIDQTRHDHYVVCRDILREAESKEIPVLSGNDFDQVAKAVIPGITATVSGPKKRSSNHTVIITLPMLESVLARHDADRFLMTLGQRIHTSFVDFHKTSFNNIFYKVVRHKRDEVLVDGEIYHRRHCNSSRIAASIENVEAEHVEELLHMYYAMELPYQHTLQTNLLARVRSLEMAAVVVRHFYDIGGRNFAMITSDDVSREAVQRRWVALNGQCVKPHRWIDSVLNGSEDALRRDLGSLTVARDNHLQHDHHFPDESWEMYMMTRSW